MVATNIVCAVVAVVVLGGDGAGGRARGVDHVTSLRAAPLLLRLGVTFLPPSRLGDEPRPVFALGRGPRRGSCRVLVRSLVGEEGGGGSLRCSQPEHEMQNQGQHRTNNIFVTFVQTTAVLSQPSLFCKGQITDLNDIVVRSGLEAWRRTCTASAMIFRSQLRGCCLVVPSCSALCCHRERGAGSTGSSRAERTE